MRPGIEKRHLWVFFWVGIVLVYAALVFWEKLKPASVFFLPSDKSERDYLNEDSFQVKFDETKKLVRQGEFPKIGIIDSGLDLTVATHEGVSFAPGEIPKDLNDDLSHGTGMFLALAAKANGFGVIGLIPEAKIFPLKIGNRAEFESMQVPFERLETAFAFARKNRIGLLAMSLSNIDSVWNKTRMQKLLGTYEKDFLLVVSAGNDAFHLKHGDKCTYVPVCNQATNLIKVGAKDHAYSNKGEVVDVWVESRSQQWRQVRHGVTNPKEVVYELKEVTSTSAAVPKVAAIAALLMKRCPDCSKEKIRLQLVSATNSTGLLDPEIAIKAPR